MKDKLKELVRSGLAFPKNVAVGTFRRTFSIVNAFMHSTLFILLTLFVGLAVGFGVGARFFETGVIRKIGGSLNGTNVKVSGPCRIDGEVRKPALAEDEVKIVMINDVKMIGVLRATRETIECDLAQTAIDYLPLLHDFSRTPMEIPEIKPMEVVKNDTELESLKGRTIRVSGTCSDSSGSEMAPLIDQNIDVIRAERLPSDKAVLKISGIMRKSRATVECLSKNVRYSILDGNGEVQVVAGQVVQAKKDLVGEVILITSTCFPDKRLPSTKKSKNLFYPLLNAKLQVTQNRFDEDGKLQYAAGVIVDNGAVVECDESKYPINWRMYDQSSMKLTPIKGAVEPEEKASVEGVEADAVKEPSN